MCVFYGHWLCAPDSKFNIQYPSRCVLNAYVYFSLTLSFCLVCEAVSIEFYMLFMIKYDSSCTLHTPVKLKSGTKCRIIKGTTPAKPSAIIFPKESTKLVWFLFAFLFLGKRTRMFIECVSTFIEYEQLCSEKQWPCSFQCLSSVAITIIASRK